MCMEGECGRRQRRGKGIRRSEDMGVVMTRIMEWEEGPCRGIDILSWILARKSANSMDIDTTPTQKIYRPTHEL